jgi:hypothetical protein
MEERIKIHCVCGKVGLVERRHIGKTITCPKCGVARIKIEDPHDSPTDEDEVQPVDTRYVPQRNQKGEIPPLAEIVPAAKLSKARHWQLTAICCLLAIIAGIMIYNQYDEWQRKVNTKEAKKSKEQFDLCVQTSVRREENDELLEHACLGVRVIDVSASDFLAFVNEQPDTSVFGRSFDIRTFEDRTKARFSSSEIEDMIERGDLFLRWAILKGAVDEAELKRTEFIYIGLESIRFTRDSNKCTHAFRFEVNIQDLFPSEFWFSDDPTYETFGSFRNKNHLPFLGGEDYLLRRIKYWKDAQERGEWK